MGSGRVSRIDPEGSREKREHNLESSLRLLRIRNFDIDQRSAFHFIISRNGRVADFWPTTGQYSIRGPKPVYRRGVFNLMREMMSGTEIIDTNKTRAIGNRGEEVPRNASATTGNRGDALSYRSETHEGFDRPAASKIFA